MISRRFSKKDIIASRRTHTRGNPSSAILYGVENPKRLIRCRPGKERINTSQTEGSFSQEFHSFHNFEWETSFQRSLLRSKSESDLKKT